MNIREQYEQLEKSIVGEYGTLSCNSLGRAVTEEKCAIRTDFQRDRDRILHSKAFRRLKHKTQVFIAPEGDHYRTRLTHTLEVSQIGRTIASALRLNENLVEAIALGHDLGHTPFGHSGEYILNEICPYGFKHYEQSLRIVEALENGKGLNLTAEVRDGIVNHAGSSRAWTPEGQIVKFADRIAYINHDIDDAIRGGILRINELPKSCLQLLGETHSQRINAMIHAVIEGSVGSSVISMSEPYFEQLMTLRSFMFSTVYVGSAAKSEEQKAVNVIKSLYEYFLNHVEALEDVTNCKDPHRIVCDYIAGMSDVYAITKYQELFVPRAWHSR